MTPFLSFAILLVSFFFIGKSADILIRALVNLGQRFYWREFIIGFVVLGIATSSPEIFVAFQAGNTGKPQISLGNLLGGIVVLFTLLIGLNAFLQGVLDTKKKFTLTNLFRFLPKGLPFRREFIVPDLFLMAGVILMPLLLLLDQKLSRVDGLIMILIYLFFIAHAIYGRRLKSWRPPAESLPLWRTILYLLIGLGGLFLCSNFVIKQAIYLANFFQVKPVILGLLLLSLGTNLPELTLTIKARKKHGEVAVGDILGSAMANIFILGLLAVFYPFQIVAFQPVIIVCVSLIIVTILLTLFLRTKNKLERWEGGVLILLFFFYLMIELFVNR